MRHRLLAIALSATLLALPSPGQVAAAQPAFHRLAKPARSPKAVAKKPVALASRVIDEEQFVLPPDGPYLVRLTNVRGRVLVRSWNKNVVYLKATKHASRPLAGTEADLYAEAEVAATRPASDTISLSTRFKSRTTSTPRVLASHLDHVDVDYMLVVPPQTAVEVTQEHGPVLVYGVDGRTKVFTRDGAITLADLHGRVEAENETGPMAFTGLRGDAIASTQKGNLTFRDVTGDVVARSNSGTMQIQVSARFGAEVSYHTVRGAIYSDLSTFQTRLVAGETGYEGILRGPLATHDPVGVRYRLDSVSGDLTIATHRGLARR